MRYLPVIRKLLKHASDIPILGAVFDAFITWLKTIIAILRNPLNFPEFNRVSTEPNLVEAIRNIASSLVISYLILIPVFVTSKADVSQADFVLLSFIRLIVACLCIHLALRLLGSRRKVRVTLALVGYMMALDIPLTTLLQLPLYLAVGPTVLTEDVRSALQDQSVLSKIHLANKHLIVICSELTRGLWSVVFNGISIFWFWKVHGLNKTRSAIGFLLGGVLGLLLVVFVISPIWISVLPYLHQMFRFI